MHHFGVSPSQERRHIDNESVITGLDMGLSDKGVTSARVDPVWRVSGSILLPKNTLFKLLKRNWRLDTSWGCIRTQFNDM